MHKRHGRSCSVLKAQVFNNTIRLILLLKSFRKRVVRKTSTRLVAMAEGNHAYPSRTRPLSPPAPMVLGPQGPGRVGRCQANPYIGLEAELLPDIFIWISYLNI